MTTDKQELEAEAIRDKYELLRALYGDGDKRVTDLRAMMKAVHPLSPGGDKRIDELDKELHGH
jgi:hypothetical protein